MYNPRQGDIIFSDFSPQSGHEQAGRRPGVIISNEQFFIRTKFAAVCPITNTSNLFPLHIPLDSGTKTTCVILTKHLKCLDVISRNIQFVEKCQKICQRKRWHMLRYFSHDLAVQPDHGVYPPYCCIRTKAGQSA